MYQYPGEDGHVEYREGLYIGYRHVDRAGLAPLFPFGVGLSYTIFAIGESQLSGDTQEPGNQLTLTVPVRNTGERAGQTVIQLYVHDVEARLDRWERGADTLHSLAARRAGLRADAAAAHARRTWPNPRPSGRMRNRRVAGPSAAT